MNKNRKIIWIVVAAIIVLAMIVALTWYISLERKGKNSMQEGSTSKINKLYTQLAEKQAYSFTTKLDNNHKIYYAKKENMAYIETIYQGKKSKTIIKNGNSYLLMEDEKAYYTYQNNETNLEKILLQLKEVKEQQYTEGREVVENKEYKYEEYEGVSTFLMQEASTTQKQSAKTRFYFDGDKLVYIKTIVGDKQELLKVEISDQVGDKLFAIPSEYKEA